MLGYKGQKMLYGYTNVRDRRSHKVLTYVEYRTVSAWRLPKYWHPPPSPPSKGVLPPHQFFQYFGRRQTLDWPLTVWSLYGRPYSFFLNKLRWGVETRKLFSRSVIMLKREVESPIPGLSKCWTRGRKPYSCSLKMLKREVESPIPDLPICWKKR